MVNSHDNSYLAPSDCHFLVPLRKHLAGKRFAIEADNGRIVFSWFWHLSLIFSTPGHKHLFHGVKNCVMWSSATWVSPLYHQLHICRFWTYHKIWFSESAVIIFFLLLSVMKLKMQGFRYMAQVLLVWSFPMSAVAVLLSRFKKP